MVYLMDLEYIRHTSREVWGMDAKEIPSEPKPRADQSIVKRVGISTAIPYNSIVQMK
jgi:hypothetical protein